MNCPRLHYHPDPSFIILKHLHSVPIEQRTPFERRTNKIFNARGNLAYLIRRILHFNVDFEEIINRMNDGSTPVEVSDDEEDEEDDNNSFEYAKEMSTVDIGGKKKDTVGKGKKEEVGVRRVSLMVGEEDGISLGGFRKKTVKLIPEESFYEEGDDASSYARKRTAKLTQTLVEKEDGVGGGGGVGGVGGRKKTVKGTQNIEHIVDEERNYWERREKSKLTMLSERFESDILLTTDGIEKVESKVVKAYSKDDHLMIKLVFNISFYEFNIYLSRFEKMKSYNFYYPEYNIENIIDFLNSKRKKMKASKKKKNIIIHATEILTNSMSPIQKHQKKRTTIINSDLNTLNFKRSSLKKLNSFLAAN